ncbi:branched-chain amino acid ABC transporter permease [Natrarchaeobius chitinivorans]|uniref:Branched-chain amino acid ABC transporter permease n=2 Tax=Natrarchaeobius chitinivorans TaxID=1679083 RepID=A0A3N6NY57_NATCH|nr:branched-chain amino acid ABC transporter permease [Natrarchaeobius chitinivorans]
MTEYLLLEALAADPLLAVGQSISGYLEVGVDGLARGFVFALLGVGITLVYGLGEVLNLAAGSFAVVTILLTIIAVDFGVPLIGAIAIALIGIGVIALLIDKGLLSIVYRSEDGERVLLGIFTTLGVAMAIDGILFNFFTGRYSVPISLGSMDIAGLSVRTGNLIIISVSTVTLVGLFLFFRETFTGKAMRTITQDEVGALHCGINPRKFRTVIFVMSAVLIGMAGVLYGLSSSVQVISGFELTVYALIVSIVGGVRSVSGTILAGIFLGLVLTYSTFIIGAYQAVLILFLVAVGAMTVRGEVGL